jgi:hypothetical protein
MEKMMDVEMAFVENTSATMRSISECSENLTMHGNEIVRNFSNSNETETLELPIDMRFNDGHLISIIVYR